MSDIWNANMAVLRDSVDICCKSIDTIKQINRSRSQSMLIVWVSTSNTGKSLLESCSSPRHVRRKKIDWFITNFAYILVSWSAVRVLFFPPNSCREQQSNCSTPTQTPSNITDQMRTKKKRAQCKCSKPINKLNTIISPFPLLPPLAGTVYLESHSRSSFFCSCLFLQVRMRFPVHGGK